VYSDLAAGVPPRCVYFDDHERLGDRGVVIVGQNPGRAKLPERQYYLNRGADYEVLRQYWLDFLVGDAAPVNRYYQRLRDLAGALDLDGPIWWTELAKCETAKESREVQTQTLRVCVSAFLARELDSVPANWPIIAASKSVFHALAFIAPKRVVIGCPHPTGALPRFSPLLKEVQAHGPAYREAKRCLESSDSAVWLRRTD